MRTLCLPSTILPACLQTEKGKVTESGLTSHQYRNITGEQRNYETGNIQYNQYWTMVKVLGHIDRSRVGWNGME